MPRLRALSACLILVLSAWTGPVRAHPAPLQTTPSPAQVKPATASTPASRPASAPEASASAVGPVAKSAKTTAKEHWATLGPDTPTLQPQNLPVLMHSAQHILDVAVLEHTPNKSDVIIRMDTGFLWRMPIRTLDAPLYLQNFYEHHIRTLVVRGYKFEYLAKQQRDGTFSTVFWSVFARLPIGFIVSQVAVILIFFAAFALFQRKLSGFITGRKIDRIDPKQIKVTFDDVAGADEAVRDMREMADFLKHPERFTRLGAKLPKGALLIGPPGTGKTLLAKAMAKESKVPFYYIAGSDFAETFKGTGPARVRALFKKARKTGGIIFIDEIEGLGRKRGSGPQIDREGEDTLDQFLTEMDGMIEHPKPILVIGATNLPEVMDPAALRPGRFDRQIYVSMPTMKGREDILKVYLRKHQAQGANIDTARLARICVGFSGADLSNLVNEALLRAAREDKPRLEHAHLMAARDKMLMGDPDHNMAMTEEERRTTALHESGHAVLAYLFAKDPVERITIIPRNRALGAVLQVPERDWVSLHASTLLGKLMVLMAGRACEEHFLGDVTTGASSDMAKAYELALSMMLRWGFGASLGTVSVDSPERLSPGTREAVERESFELVRQVYRMTLTLVGQHQDFIAKLAEHLLEVEDMQRDDFEAMAKPELVRLQPVPGELLKLVHVILPKANFSPLDEPEGVAQPEGALAA